jgi:phosphotransferase system enzyme I (PtsI)
VQRLIGIGVSPGVAVGRAVLLMQNPLIIRFSIPADQVVRELGRLEAARQQSRAQLEEIKARLGHISTGDLGPLFDAQLLMLQDPMLLQRAVTMIREQHVNAEWAIQQAFRDLSEIFNEIEDQYLRERRGDVADVVGRLRLNLSRARPGGRDLFRDVDAGSVLVADELTPSVAAQVDWRKIRAFASDVGSRTYHTAILARSLQVPAVVGLGSASAGIPPGATVIIDGTAGEVIVDPSEAMIAEVQRQTERWPSERLGGAGHDAPAATADGVRLSLQANIELPDDIAPAREYGAEGVGLCRSEFLFATAPADGLTEEAQYRAYRSILEQMAPAPVTIRTFDIDEEQLESWRQGTPGGDPRAGLRSRGPLGLRAIRLSLARRDLFRTQLRALLRAAPYGRLRIIFPFVAGVEELREARGVVREVAAGLAAEGMAPPEVPIGVMIEIPSAAITADLLAREADFFSIGTNDLIQYSLAVDRTDARVSGLYEPLHPALLRTIRHVVRSAAEQRIPVSLCGEMASDPVLLPLLVGLGLTEFSMGPVAIPIAKRVLRDLRARDLKRIAKRALRLPTVAEVESYVVGALSAAARRTGQPVADRTRPSRQ